MRGIDRDEWRECGLVLLVAWGVVVGGLVGVLWIL